MWPAGGVSGADSIEHGGICSVRFELERTVPVLFWTTGTPFRSFSV